MTARPYLHTHDLAPIGPMNRVGCIGWSNHAPKKDGIALLNTTIIASLNEECIITYECISCDRSNSASPKLCKVQAPPLTRGVFRGVIEE